MAKTYTLIQAQTLTSTASSVTFSNIPQTYTDLRLFISCRSNRATEIDDQFNIYPNNSSSNLTFRFIRGDGNSITSSTVNRTYIPAAGATANSFSNVTIFIPNYANNKHKSFYVDSVQENNATTAYMSLQSVLWSDTTAISSLVFSPVSGTAFTSGSTFSLYGVGATRATGGTITSDANFTYHTFTSSGTFTALENITNLEYLVVAGGGGGSRINSGGGAGGLRCTAEATGGGSGLEGKLKLNAGVSFSAIVGSGGSGNSNVTGAGTSGSSSGFMNIQSVGGGGGGSYVGSGGNVSTGVGLTGGSGGGGGYSEVAGTTTGGSGTLGQGFAGGNGSQGKSGGGGGAGAAGSAGAVGQHGGNGGNGVAINSFGYATNTGQLVGGFYYYAGGGGAGDEDYSLNAGTGGLGGGGNGANRTGSATRIAGSAGTANTGGGGGGGENGGTGGYNGGSGIVIIRYPN